MKTRILFLIVLFMSITLSAQEMKTFTKNNYTIDYPATWASSEQKVQPSVQFIILSDESTQAKDKFRENLNLSKESLRGQKISTSEYAKISLDQVKAQIPNANIISNEPVTINGIEGEQIIWSADFGNSMVLKFNQFIFTRGDSGYALTFSSTVSEYDDYVKAADAMMKSFKFVN
ncbi:MAG: hypothetical protein ED556_11255 [Winogradskyella sp.]|uniref:hypothetical protein n=1 Tax=Winogradskyella sp. TaxID=1883156 RepID=UPI000F3D3F40|nr:hypothetical protein [Winogradskyella sp.]RNC85135.1 MAG: hypothetical protein ED556_11255 [Winogradskyella sp.]